MSIDVKSKQLQAGLKCTMCMGKLFSTASFLQSFMPTNSEIYQHHAMHQLMHDCTGATKTAQNARSKSRRKYPPQKYAIQSCTKGAWKIHAKHVSIVEDEITPSSQQSSQSSPFSTLSRI
jgi:hypothetical protein